MAKRKKPQSKGLPSPSAPVVPPQSNPALMPLATDIQPTPSVVEPEIEALGPHNWDPPDKCPEDNNEASWRQRADYWQIRADHKEERYRRKDDYLKERARSLDDLKEGSKLHDTTIISVTGGAIALSFAFIDKVAADPATLPYVGVAWFFLILSFGCILSSFLSSQRACERCIGNLDQSYFTQTEVDARNSFATVTRWLNRISHASLWLGVVFLGVFAYLNLDEKLNEAKGNKMPKKSPQQGPVQVPASNNPPAQLPASINNAPKPNAGYVPPQPVNPTIKINPPPPKKD